MKKIIQKSPPGLTLDRAADAAGATRAVQVRDAVLGRVHVVHMADCREVQPPRG